MNDSPIEPTEEQLTAYALDELDAQERTAVEFALERDSALQAQLEEIRSAVGAVEAAYASEAATVLSDVQREEVIAKAEDTKPGLWTLRPVFIKRLAGLVAALFLIGGITATLLPTGFEAGEMADDAAPVFVFVAEDARLARVSEQSQTDSIRGDGAESSETSGESESWWPEFRNRFQPFDTERNQPAQQAGQELGATGPLPTSEQAVEVQREEFEPIAASGYLGGDKLVAVVPDSQPKLKAKRSADQPAEPNHAPEPPNAGAGSLTQQEKEVLTAIGYIVDGEAGSAVVPDSQSKPKAERPVSRTAFNSRARVQPSTQPISQEEQERLRAMGYSITPAPDQEVARRIQESLGTGGGRQNEELGSSLAIRNGFVSGDGSVSVSVPILGDIPAIRKQSMVAAAPGAVEIIPFFFREDVGQYGISTDRFQVAGTPQDGRLRRDPNWAWTGIRSVSPPPPITPGTEAYQYFVENTFKAVAQAPLSTFSIDVDTASYANMRRFLNNNQVPPKDSVRIEELINYFDYAYEVPSDDSEHPFAAHMEVASAPWNPQHKLVQVGIKGKEVERGEQPPSNLVFLLDVSGSMKQPNKLPLVKQAIGLLARQLRSVDRVAIVVYAGSSGMVLNSTPGDNKNAILGAVERLSAGGSTNGGAGIQLAYNEARQNLIPGGVNRVILATDGDFNVGMTNRGDLVRLVEARAKGGVFLTALGFGMGNLKDDTLEMLSNKGNGNYAYVDTFAEARKVFVDELNGTLVTIAKDVKIQVEFNPAQVARYRLIGYENRALAARDFNDDTKDAGEIGAGHTVTALYEIVPVGVAGSQPNVNKLKYQSKAKPTNRAEEVSKLIESHVNTELLTLKLRYKQPEGTTSTLMEYPLSDRGEAFAQADGELQFATAVAAFGMKLRGSQHAGATTWQDVLAWAENGLGRDAHGYRNEFLGLVRTAQRFVPDRMVTTTVHPEIRLLNVQVDSNGKKQALISENGTSVWYFEGVKFDRYTLLSIDTDTECVAVFSEYRNRPIEICVEQSGMQLRGFIKSGSEDYVLIQVGGSRQQYKEGDVFSGYQLLDIDRNTKCVDVLITSTGEIQTICLDEEMKVILNSIGYVQ